MNAVYFDYFQRIKQRPFQFQKKFILDFNKPQIVYKNN